jgi:hypothetical protein
LRAAEASREAQRQARVAELRKRFVDGPVVVIPRGSGASFMTRGVTPLGDAGTVFPKFRVSGPWGSLEAEQVLVSTDQSLLTVPGPPTIQDDTLTGDGWKVILASGWTIRAEGDRWVVVIREGGTGPAANFGRRPRRLR